MSVKALTWALEQPIGHPTAKLVLICLANYADANSEAYPGQETIAGVAGCTSRTVREHLKRLEASGLIARTRRTRKDGSRTSDLYILRLSNRKDSTAQPEKSSGHEPVSEPTRPNGRDADASAQEVLTESVWGICPAKLQALGVADRQSRSLLGKWLKDHKPEAVLRAVEAAARVGTRDPIPYIKQTLEAANTKSAKTNRGWIVRRGSKPFEAWQQHYTRLNDPGAYAFKIRDAIEVPRMWPGGSR
jgi:DNA-binding MarR family transcriptional regulator